jgi:hypothetical protein
MGMLAAMTVTLVSALPQSLGFELVN